MVPLYVDVVRALFADAYAREEEVRAQPAVLYGTWMQQLLNTAQALGISSLAGIYSNYSTNLLFQFVVSDRLERAQPLPRFTKLPSDVE